MDAMSPVFAFILGVLLRFVTPIAITLVGIYFLRQLDLRWQTEAAEGLLSPVVEKAKCWDVKGCSEEKMKTCKGCQSEEPCWQAFRKGNGYLQEECLGCNVFQQAPIPVSH